MTKTELIKEYERLSTEKKVHIQGINYNSNKSELENAIHCLLCDDETLDDYLTVIKLVYPNTYNVIKNNGDYKTHPHNRLYVYNTARAALR